jgi:hypothetical protein
MEVRASFFTGAFNISFLFTLGAKLQARAGSENFFDFALEVSHRSTAITLNDRTPRYHPYLRSVQHQAGIVSDSLLREWRDSESIEEAFRQAAKTNNRSMPYSSAYADLIELTLSKRGTNARNQANFLPIALNTRNVTVLVVHVAIQWLIAERAKLVHVAQPPLATTPCSFNPSPAAPAPKLNTCFLLCRHPSIMLFQYQRPYDLLFSSHAPSVMPIHPTRCLSS